MHDHLIAANRLATIPLVDTRQRTFATWGLPQRRHPPHYHCGIRHLPNLQRIEAPIAVSNPRRLSVSDRVLGATLRRAGMPEYRSTRILSAVAFVSLAGVFAQSTYGARAAEECLSKPNSPAPQGEHWYYRMDHANGRQCWRLGPVGLRVQKTAPASEKRSAPAAATQSETSARAQRPATTGHASAEVASETDVAAAAAPVYWLDASRLLNQPSTVPPATQQPSLEERSASSPDPSPSADESPAPARSVVASAGDSLPQTVARAEEPQRIVPIAKPATSIVDDDHTFALLLLMFVTLAIAGRMLHYS